jgi:pilus assembly protein Flp/PilA
MLTAAGDPPSWTSKEIVEMHLFQALVAAARRDDGQGLAEYALILALIAIIAIVALIFLGGQVSQILSTVGSSV